MRGHEVVVPKMPQTEEPRINKWVPELIKQVGKVNNNTFFVGHSMGNQAIARFLEQLPQDQIAGGAVFVAGFFDNLSGLKNDTVVRSVVKEWLETKIDLDEVKQHLLKSVAIFSDDDPYVPLNNADTFRNIFGADIHILEKQGHFSGDDYQQLPKALEELEKMGL